MKPLTATGTLRAYITSKWDSIDDILDLVSKGKASQALSTMGFAAHDMTESGWNEVGIAEVTITFHPIETVAAKELEALKKQLEKVRAENHVRENAILDRISKLQAITYEPSTQE